MSVFSEALARALPLLLRDPMDLSGAELSQLLTETDGLADEIRELWRAFPSRWQEVVRYRARKAELVSLNDEQLVAMRQGIRDDRSQVEADDTDDELPDSFFEPPLLDSDEHIVNELLEERGVE